MKGNVIIQIPGELANAAQNQPVASTEQIKDYQKGKSQEVINQENDSRMDSVEGSISTVSSAITTEKTTREQQEALLRAELNAKQLEIGAVQTDEKPTEFSANHLTSGAVYNSVAPITGKEANVTRGQYFGDNSGATKSDSSWCTSALIPCKAGDSIVLHTGWKSDYSGTSNSSTFYAYFDADGAAIPNIGNRSGITPSLTITVPNNSSIAYIGGSFHLDGFADAYVTVNGNMVFKPHFSVKGSAETTAENVVSKAFDIYDNGEEIDITYEVEVEENYIYSNEEKVQKNNSFCTKPYALKKGDTVIINSIDRYSYGNDVIGYVDSDNVYHKLLHWGSTEAGEVSYTLQEDYDVVLSVTRPSSRLGIGVFFKVQRKSQNDKWFELKFKKYYEDWLLGRPNNWPVVGGVFDFNDSMVSTNYQVTKMQLINCQEGDAFIINVSRGYGNNNKEAWCVTDKDGNVLDSASNNNYITCVDYELTIPTGGRYLFVTSDVNFTDTYVYKKVVEEPEPEITGEDFSDLHHRTNPSRVIPSVREKYTNASTGQSGFVTHSIPVAAGEVYRLTTFIMPDSGTAYYAVLDSNLIVIQKVVGKTWTFGLEITIPDGGCYLLFNSGKTEPSASLYRIKCADSLKKTEHHKEPLLIGMSMRNAVSGSVSAVVKRLTLSWISDNHYDMTNYKRFIEFSNFYKGVIDAVLNTGDNNHMSDTDNGFVNTALKYVPEIPMMNCIGNHDAFGQSRHGSGNSLVSGSKLWNGEKYIKPFLDSKCVAGDDYCYYYRDFTEQKIRVIVLNDYDKPRWADGNYWITTTDESEIAGALEFDRTVTYNVGDVVHYKGQYLKCKTQSKLEDNGTKWPSDAAPVAKTSIHCRYLTQKQVDFVISTMNVESGWSIIFAAHQTLESIDDNTELASEKWNSHSNYTFNKVRHGFGQNGYIIQDLIVAYLNRTTLNKTYKCITPNSNPLASDVVLTNLPDFYPDVTIAADFSSAKGDVICFLNGHQHSDSCYYSSHTGNKKFLTIGNINGGYVDIDGDNQTGGKFYNVWNHADVIKGGVYSRDCFNVISFDTTEKAVYLLRIGVDVNDQFVKRDFVRISYAHDAG